MIRIATKAKCPAGGEPLCTMAFALPGLIGAIGVQSRMVSALAGKRGMFMEAPSGLEPEPQV
jgi:hypothetical protein